MSEENLKEKNEEGPLLENLRAILHVRDAVRGGQWGQTPWNPTVLQKAMAFVIDVYKLVKSFPTPTNFSN